MVVTWLKMGHAREDIAVAFVESHLFSYLIQYLYMPSLIERPDYLGRHMYTINPIFKEEQLGSGRKSENGI